MIYGKVTALLKLLKLQILFTWSGSYPHTQNASGKPCGSVRPPMTTHLNQKETGWLEHERLPAPHLSQRNTSEHFSMKWYKWYLFSLCARSFLNVSRSPWPLYGDLKKLFGKLQCVLFFFILRTRFNLHTTENIVIQVYSVHSVIVGTHCDGTLKWKQMVHGVMKKTGLINYITLNMVKLPSLSE